MSIYIVTDKATGGFVYEYKSDTPIEWDGMAFAVCDHTPMPDTPPHDVPESTKFGGRRILTKLEFRSLFSDATIKWIDRFESQFEGHAYLTDAQKDEIRTAFANYHEATDVNLDDPRWPPGLGLYVALGGMDSVEITEVLRG